MIDPIGSIHFAQISTYTSYSNTHIVNSSKQQLNHEEQSKKQEMATRLYQSNQV